MDKIFDIQEKSKSLIKRLMIYLKEQRYMLI